MGTTHRIAHELSDALGVPAGAVRYAQRCDIVVTGLDFMLGVRARSCDSSSSSSSSSKTDSEEWVSEALKNEQSRKTCDAGDGTSVNLHTVMASEHSGQWLS